MADDRDDSPPPIVYVEEEFDWDLSPYTIPEGRIFADAGGGDATLIQVTSQWRHISVMAYKIAVN